MIPIEEAWKNDDSTPVGRKSSLEEAIGSKMVEQAVMLKNFDCIQSQLCE